MSQNSPEFTPPVHMRTQRPDHLAQSDTQSHAGITMWLSRVRLLGLGAGQWVRRHSFAPSWLPPRWRHPAVGYVMAGLVQVVAVLLTSLLTLAFPRFAFPSAVVLLGVVLVALNWGALPALVAAVVSVLLIDSVVVTPLLGPALNSVANVLALVCLVGIAAVISMLASAAERSKRRAMEERMEERMEARARELVAQQMQAHMDEFLAVASHDLRSPLTALRGYLDLATRSYTRLASSVVDSRPDLSAQVERVRKHLDAADQSSERLIRLIAVLFDTSKARVGTLDLTPAPCDLVGLVREQVAAIQVSAPQRTIHLEEPSGGPVDVIADADRIGQVITNYLTNALKYSPASQPVRVWVEMADGRARVAVEDHGPGLPPGEQEHIWQQFYRAEGVQPQSAMGGSLGLGLHVCKRIIEAHGGIVGVRSEVGHGSTFWFELPLAEEGARTVTLASLAEYNRHVDVPAHVTDAD